MKTGFFRRLALSNIRKNYRFYVPRVLSESGLLGCFYIALTLAMDDRLSKVSGGSYIPTFMWMAVVILALLSAVLMFYTNSFLMRQRKRELGIYNILGMEKRHVGKVLFHESLLSSLASVALGLILGMLFYKLCSLLICRLLQASVITGFYYISPLSLLPAAAFFLLLDGFIYLINLSSVSRMKPVELLQSRSAGEKEPKVKWVMLVFGVLTLGAGYTLAIITKNPLEALLVFFLAVILVIIGTYFLFLTGSTFVLKALKRSDRIYYHKRRMPAIAGLLYRMKQNAAGLASIALLATGVLVMVSTTVSLYSGYERTLNASYPQDLYFSAIYTGADGKTESIPREELETFVREAAAGEGVEIASVTGNDFLSVAYSVKDNRLYAFGTGDADTTFSTSLSSVTNFIFITEQSYTSLTGKSLGLTGREIALCRIASPVSGIRAPEGEILLRGVSHPIRETLALFPINPPALATGFTCYGVVVADDAAMEEVFEAQRADYGRNAADAYTRRVAVIFADREAASTVGDALREDLKNAARAYAENRGGSNCFFDIDSYWDAREALLGMYGTLFFLGILLGTVCLFATVLIIYYKQISEGYEDRERFAIMQKVGMSRAEVEKTINTQVLLVFFLPLLVAAVHMAFAFPLLNRILAVLSLFSVRRFILCTLITYGVFALVYVLIYRATSKTYFRIVK